MNKEFLAVEKIIDGYEKEMEDVLARMIAIKAISPQSGGAGESKRADFLQKLLKEWGFATKRYSYKDNTGTERPSLIARFGNAKRTLWLIPHIDTVSEGDIKLWKTDPFKMKTSGGKIYGRGTNDDGQGVISAIFAMKALKAAHARLGLSVGIALVGDEETGSEYGMERLVKEDVFKAKDLFIVPDAGDEQGDDIEVKEKGRLAVKITVRGEEGHAAFPRGRDTNSYRNTMKIPAVSGCAPAQKVQRKGSDV